MKKKNNKNANQKPAQTKKNCGSEIFGGQSIDNLKGLSDRKFQSGKKYLKKHLISMISDRNPEMLPKFWDDPSLSLEESTRIEWMAGVEVHLYKNIVALYGRDPLDHRKKYLSPINVMFNNPEGYAKFQKEISKLNINIRRFLMETTGIYHFPVAWFLQEAYPEAEVIVMNAKHLKDYMPKVSKNDKADAVRMAQVAHFDELLKRSYIPHREEYALRELMRQRGNLKRNIVRYKNGIKKILASDGYTLPFNFDNDWERKLLKTFMEISESLGDALKLLELDYMIKKNAAKFTEWESFNMPVGFKANVLLLMGMLEQSELQLLMIEAALMQKIENNETLKQKSDLLEDCLGIGTITAASIIIESGNINRFYSVSHYLSYCGISMTGATSGYISPESEKEKQVAQPKPNPLSNHRLKMLYIGATGSIMKKIGGKLTATDMKDDMIRYASRYVNDSRLKMKIKFKLAANLARKIYYCLKHEQRYDPRIEYKKQEQNREKQKNNDQTQLIPKRNRQAWAYVRMQLLRTDMETILKGLSVVGAEPEAMETVKRSFMQFMEKYKIPRTAAEWNGAVV